MTPCHGPGAPQAPSRQGACQVPSKEAPEPSWCPQGWQRGWGHFFRPSPACRCVGWRSACAQPLNVLDTQGHWEGKAAAGAWVWRGAALAEPGTLALARESADEQQPKAGARGQGAGPGTRPAGCVALDRSRRLPGPQLPHQWVKIRTREFSGSFTLCQPVPSMPWGGAGCKEAQGRACRGQGACPRAVWKLLLRVALA